MNKTKELLQAVINGIQDKKGNNIVSLNFKNTGSSVCDYFVICDAPSGRQVEAIADSVIEFVRKETSDKEIYKEGYENAEWILIDYSDIIVHIFQKPHREEYNLEGLWADAEIKKIEAA